MSAVPDPVCLLTKKGKAGIGTEKDRSLDSVKPITGRHHLATDPKRKASSSRRRPRGGVMTPPTRLLLPLNDQV